MSMMIAGAPAPKPAAPVRKITIRRFVIREAEYDQVLGWLKKNTESPGQVLRMPADMLPKIGWAKQVPLRLVKGAHGAHKISVQEHAQWKTLIHTKAIDGYLREALLSSSGDVPMSRDAGYHIVQKRTVGISRRALAAFMSKQEVLQITRDRNPIMKQAGRPLESRGHLELDLVEAKGRDIGKFVHHFVKDFYWITLIDRLTGWLEVEQITKKDVKTVAPKLKKMLIKMARVLKREIKYIRSDSGSEFKADTQKVLKDLGIRHKFVKSGNRIEQANKSFQKIWYRLMRLGRGDLKELDSQATAIFNNTKSTITGQTPLEALDVADTVLAEVYNEERKKRKVPEYKAVAIKPGDRVRYLIEKVSGKYGKEFAYKSYRGKHWSPEVYPVVKFNEHTDKYYVAQKWRLRDKLLKVPGVDAITRDKVVAKHKKHKKDWTEKSGFEI